MRWQPNVHDSGFHAIEGNYFLLTYPTRDLRFAWTVSRGSKVIAAQEHGSGRFDSKGATSEHEARVGAELAMTLDRVLGRRKGRKRK